MSYEKIKILIEELFYALTAALVIFAVMEIIRPRIVLAYINLSWLLLFCLAVGFYLLLISKKQ